MQETHFWFLGQEYPLEKGMATHFSILAWRIPWTETPGRLESMGLQKSQGHDLATKRQQIHAPHNPVRIEKLLLWWPNSPLIILIPHRCLIYTVTFWSKQTNKYWLVHSSLILEQDWPRSRVGFIYRTAGQAQLCPQAWHDGWKVGIFSTFPRLGNDTSLVSRLSMTFKNKNWELLKLF